MYRCSICMLVLLAVFWFVTLPDEGVSALTNEPEFKLLLKLDGQVPLERVLVLTDIAPESGPGKIWICNDPDCPEGCNSKDPYWGNGLILEESRKAQGK